MAEKRYCAFGCGVPLDFDHQSTLRWEYLGWVKKRGTKAGGGIHAIALPQATGAVAHATCVEKAQRGIHPNQQSFDGT